jgi:hypothetical protein
LHAIGKLLRRFPSKMFVLSGLRLRGGQKRRCGLLVAADIVQGAQQPGVLDVQMGLRIEKAVEHDGAAGVGVDHDALGRAEAEARSGGVRGEGGGGE